MEVVSIKLLRRTRAYSPNLNVLGAVSKGMQAVKLLQQNPPAPVLCWGVLANRDSTLGL